METLNLPGLFLALKNFGIVGLVLVLWYLGTNSLRKIQDEHKKEIQSVLNRYRDDMQEMRHMYESNVSLVNDYHSIASDLKDVVIYNTQVMTKMSEQIRQNEFCPMQRVEKKTVIKGA